MSSVSFQCETFPEIDVRPESEVGLNAAQKLHRSIIQGSEELPVTLGLKFFKLTYRKVFRSLHIM